MEKIIRITLIAVILVLLAALGIFAIRYTRDVGELRRAVVQLEERNRQLELANNRSAELIDAITKRVGDAQSALAGAGTTVEKIRRLIDAIQAISLDLRGRPSGIVTP